MAASSRAAMPSLSSTTTARMWSMPRRGTHAYVRSNQFALSR